MVVLLPQTRGLLLFQILLQNPNSHFFFFFFLFFFYIDFVVFSPTFSDEVSLPDGQYPEVHVVNDGAPKFTHDRFREDEQRLEKMIERISKREKRLESLLERLGEEGTKLKDKSEGGRVPVLPQKVLPPRQNQIVEEENKQEFVQPNLYQKSAQKDVKEDTTRLLAVKRVILSFSPLFIFFPFFFPKKDIFLPFLSFSPLSPLSPSSSLLLLRPWNMPGVTTERMLGEPMS